MDGPSIIFLMMISAVFAVYPDVKKHINFYNLIMAITCFFTESTPRLENSEISEDENKSTEPSTPYESKYINKFRSLAEIEVDMERIKYTMVMDYTPYGNVIMMYNEDKDAFTYYTDHSMPYRFLEAVAQKFAILCNAKKLVIDTEQEIEKLKEINKTSETETEENQKQTENQKKDEPEAEKKSVFAKFKSYNQMTTPGVGSNVREVPTTKKKEGPELLLEKTNTYSFEGKISNMKNIIQPMKPDSHDTRRKMTFADFKKLTNN